MGNEGQFTLYRLRKEYNCKSWNNLTALESEKGWLLSEVTQPDGVDGVYLQAGDSLVVEQTGQHWDLRVIRSNVTVRTMRGIQLQGLDGFPGLWSKVSDEGYDVYLYLLDKVKEVDGVEKRLIHVDVFYPNSRFDADRPGPTTVVVL